MTHKKSSWPNWRYPDWRELAGNLTAERWLEGRRQDDGAEGLWRVHDRLYDLTSWVQSHPGGAQWLEETKGTDITEAFECHHIGPKASKTLENYYVRPANIPRNSPFTFKENGFYHVLKSRAYKVLKDVKPGPSEHSKRLLETLAALTIILSLMAATYHSFILGISAGFFMALTTTCAHNFFHLRDNWRMYLFNLSLLTVRQWRVSHALSHHLFPNTHLDLEVAMFEPFMLYFPRTDKSKLFGLLSALYSPLLYPFFYFGEAAKRLILTKPAVQDLITLIIPSLMVVVGGVPVLEAVVSWICIIMVSSFCFGVIGLNAAHHHPEIFHNGDKPREDSDWGLFMLDATRDRVEIYGATNLVLVTFGDHTLHHLFPTVDHAHLHALYPILQQTCKDFGIEFKLKTTWQLIVGQFQQLMNNTPNLKDR